MHVVYDQVAAAVSVPVLHLADATAARLTGAGLDRVGLLGTSFTMEQPFYRERLAERGVTALVPGDEDRAEVHRVIYEELVRGIVADRSREAFRAVIGRLVEEGAQGIILGCTEIELLIGPEDSPVPVFPTARIHIEDAVERALA